MNRTAAAVPTTTPLLLSKTKTKTLTGEKHCPTTPPAPSHQRQPPPARAHALRPSSSAHASPPDGIGESPLLSSAAPLSFLEPFLGPLQLKTIAGSHCACAASRHIAGVNAPAHQEQPALARRHALASLIEEHICLSSSSSCFFFLSFFLRLPVVCL